MDNPAHKTRLALVESIFHEAMDALPRERDALIARLAAGDAEVIAEVQSLLKASEDTDQLLEKPAAEAVRARQNTPKSIGPFRIIRLLGEGGMGCVYEAEQDAPRRRVALKIVYSGMWSQSVSKRFEHEIEILAQLQHPGIARFYQAGTVNIGGAANAYFAMELIEGKPLTTYVAERGLVLEAQLELLARVCDAVQHAHQRGVIHRDLKPANILVEPPRDAGDAIGQPKVLDFGIARDTAADAATIVTRAGEFVGTLGYMSPEQCDALPLDTRSDVYSLGVVCFETLSGTMPVDVRTRPVTEAITMMRNGTQTRLGSVRRELKGDIETVIHKALAREPERRYESASELAADLRRVVRNEPILARPASGLYHLRKFAGRNRVLVGAAAAVLVALSAGLAGSMTMYFKAETARKGESQQGRIAQERLESVIAERKRADLEAELTGAVQEYLIGDLLVAASPSRLGADVKLVDVLKYASEHVEERFKNRPEVQGEIRTRLAEVYAELGRYDQSAEQSRRAMEILSQSGMGESERWVSAATQLCSALGRMNKLPEAIEVGARATEVAERTLPATVSSRFAAMQAWAEALQKSGRFKEAEKMLTTNLPAVEALSASARNPLTSILSTLGACYIAEGRIDDLALVARRGYELQLRDSGDENATTLAALNNLLGVLIRTRKVAEASKLATDLPARAARVFPEGHVARVYLCLNASVAIRLGGNPEEALRAGLAAYDASCKAFDPFRWETERCVGEIRFALKDLHDHSDETGRWGKIAQHIRLVAAGPNEKDSVMSCISEVAQEMSAAKPESAVTAVELVEGMWKEVDERAAPGDARRARYCGNVARAAAALKMTELAKKAIAAAEEAMTHSPRQEEDRAIVESARREIDVH